MRRVIWGVVLVVLWSTAGACSARHPAAVPPPSPPRDTIAVTTTPVPLDPGDPARGAVGHFVYAGGIAVSSVESSRLHGLSDLTVTGRDHVTAVGDEGVWFDARLLFDTSDRLVGLAEARLSSLLREDGVPVEDKADADAEGLAPLPGVGRLVSFERRHRVVLYPETGRPRLVPSPTEFPDNGGMEAIAADPEAGPDAYVVGGEASGETWACRVSGSCVKGPTIDKPFEYGLVAMQRLGAGRTAVVLRAWDPIRGNRVSLRVLGPTGVIDQLDLARPLTVDNIEGVAAVARPSGGFRFYLLSDDNASRSQRTLLMAFDWQPR